MLRTIALSAGSAALLLASPAFAHHPSGAGSTGGAGPIATVPGVTMYKGQSSAAVVYEHIELDPLSDAQLGGHPHPHSLDAIIATSLLYSYGVTDDLTVTLRLPFVRRTNIRDGHGGPGGEGPGAIGDAAGVGDLSVFGQYRFYQSRATQTDISLLAGLTMPTGDTSVTNAHPTDPGPFEAEFQPGSGAWSPSLGLAMTKRWGAWSFDANVLYQFTGDGVQDTNLGDRFLYNAAVSYRIHGPFAARRSEPMYHGGPDARHEHDHRHEHGPGHRHDRQHNHHHTALDLVLEMNGEWHDRQSGEHGFHSGGNTVYLSPGLRLSVGDWSGFASAGVPIVNDLNGIQPEAEWRVLTGVSVNF